jgi:hypothetical protein
VSSVCVRVRVRVLVVLEISNYFYAILCYSQSGPCPRLDLAIFFGYKMNMKVNFLKYPSILLATLLESTLYRNLAMFLKF